ncbi:MAG TPA: cytochrome c biogenesis protein CcsA [Candidatus Kapabacteria bacterium]|nr:cytochrome c biogenesis protein CcsA [Candidatus Kapabacteria bacterium]
MIWKTAVIAFLTVVIIVSIAIPIGGTFGDAAQRSMLGMGATPVTGTVLKNVDVPQHVVTVRDRAQQERDILFTSSRDLNPGDNIVCSVTFDAGNKQYDAVKLVSVNPLFTFPLITGLDERARIMFYHVPMSWVATIAFVVSMIYGIMYLRKKNTDHDTKSAAAAGLGLLFCLLATITGSIWARFNWGSFWNWDPRETSIFILLLVYGAYFSLRSAIDSAEKRASLSAVYSILAAVTVPFFIFIMPRIMPGLHPGSEGDVNSGPIVSGQIDAWMRITYMSSFIGFIGIFIWLFQLRVRIARLAEKV